MQCIVKHLYIYMQRQSPMLNIDWVYPLLVKKENYRLIWVTFWLTFCGLFNAFKDYAASCQVEQVGHYVSDKHHDSGDGYDGGDGDADEDYNEDDDIDVDDEKMWVYMVRSQVERLTPSHLEKAFLIVFVLSSSSPSSITKIMATKIFQTGKTKWLHHHLHICNPPSYCITTSSPTETPNLWLKFVLKPK